MEYKVKRINKKLPPLSEKDIKRTVKEAFYNNEDKGEIKKEFMRLGKK